MKLKHLFEMEYSDLRTTEDIISRMFKDLELDVSWTVHFKERAVNREEGITSVDLIAAFKKLKEKYGPVLKAAHDNHEKMEVVLQDLSTELNIPFGIDFTHKDPKKRKYLLRGITIMRKTPDKFFVLDKGTHVLKVENADAIDLTEYLSEVLDKVQPYKLASQKRSSDSMEFIYEIDVDPVIYVSIKKKIVLDEIIAEACFYTTKDAFFMLNTFSSGKASSIFATVINICEQHNTVDAWFFSTKFLESGETQNKRSRIYAIIAKRMASKHNLNYNNINIGDDTFYILSKNEITKPKVMAVVKTWH